MLTKRKIDAGISQKLPAEVGFPFFETPEVIYFP
jgi:hypothetical protein